MYIRMHMQLVLASVGSISTDRLVDEAKGKHKALVWDLSMGIHTKVHQTPWLYGPRGLKSCNNDAHREDHSCSFGFNHSLNNDTHQRDASSLTCRHIHQRNVLLLLRTRNKRGSLG